MLYTSVQFFCPKKTEQQANVEDILATYKLDLKGVRSLFEQQLIILNSN